MITFLCLLERKEIDILALINLIMGVIMAYSIQAS